MATTKKTTAKATTTEVKEEKKMAKTTTKGTETKAPKKTAPKKAEPKKAEPKTEKKEAPKKTPVKVTLKKLESMKGGDRIAPKNNAENWFMKIPSGVYEGRFESHASGEVFTAERVVEMLYGIDCKVTKRKELVLETYYDKKEDLYVIPNDKMSECMSEVMEKLELGKAKDGFRFCLFADKENYTLVELDLDF